MALPLEAVAAVSAYEVHRVVVSNLSAALLARNGAIAIVKEQSASANVAALTADLVRLTAIKSRHAPAAAQFCDDYLDEKAAEAVTERLRDQAHCTGPVSAKHLPGV